LIVTEGVGWTYVEGGPVLEFHVGDVLLCPADKRHWHGAKPREGMTHLAITEALDASNVTRMKKVEGSKNCSLMHLAGDFGLLSF